MENDLMATLVAQFLAEADDLLASIETTALNLSSGDAAQDSKEAVHTLFRAFHTIKGNAGTFGYSEIQKFTHHVENLLDLARNGKVEVSDDLPNLILSAADHVKILLNMRQGGDAPEDGAEAQLLRQIDQLSKGAGLAGTPHAAAGAPAKPAARWNVCFQPTSAIFAQCAEPIMLLDDLKQLGECRIEGHIENVPRLEDLDPMHCHLWWNVYLSGAVTADQIREVFIFAAEETDLRVEPAPPEVTAVETAAAAESGPKTKEGTGKNGPREAMVKVPSAKLDRLVNLVGELVMNQSRLATAAARTNSAELAAPVEEIERLVAALRDDVLQIRMMPIGSIFGRFKRLVHDLSKELGKEIRLITEGEDTELDKSVLDQLADPLVHLVRNSADHGIESGADRVAKGKPAGGTIRLIASHRGSDVVVSIEDDGAGMNRDRIRAKAIANHLIAPDANLSDKEILNLILLPGFSTAQSVTSISGRGVGMDVVKRQIDALHGTLTLDSEEGKGSRVSLTLPLTLAIIDGLLVEVGGDQYVIPMAEVTENVELTNAERCRNNGRNLVAVRGELIPYIDLRESFGLPGEAPPISKIVLVRHENQRLGLVVDRVLGTHQTVIQSLGAFFRKIAVVSGSTVMGDGRVALILDIAGVARHAGRRGGHTAESSNNELAA